MPANNISIDIDSISLNNVTQSAITTNKLVSDNGGNGHPSRKGKKVGNNHVATKAAHLN